MAIGIDALDVEDEFEVESTQSESNNEEKNDPQEEEVSNENDDDEMSHEVEESEDGDSNEEDDIINSLLKSKGIDDPNKIKFENADGEIEEIAWNDLTRDEQINILKHQEAEAYRDDTSLDDYEIDLINRLRLSGMSPDEYFQMIKQQGVAEYTAQQEPAAYHYTVDDLSDEELYVLDLQARVEDITDEELKEALDRAMSNPDLFAKEIAGIRDEYKNLEDDRNQRDAALQQQQLEEQRQIYSNNVINAIQGFSNVGELDIELDNNDKDEIYTFLTGSNQAGVSYLAQALNDPDTLVKMAWFAMKGDDVINSISEYYKNEITKARRAGYEEGMKKATPKKTEKPSKVVVKKADKNSDTPKRKSIDDLDW